MHYSLLLIADGTKTLEDMMKPFNEEFAWENGEDANAKWDWYVVGGRWKGLIEANVGAHGERYAHDFDNTGQHKFGERTLGYWHPYEPGRFDVARVRDITHIDTRRIHDMLTPDGVWHSCEFYVPEGMDGRYFFENTWFYDGLIEKLKQRYPNCLAFVIDYHS